MDNYEFCADFAAKRGGRALDYGCGRGSIVKLMLAKGLDAYGCDVFYEGGDYSPQVPVDLRGSRILRMENNRIPFPDAHFNVVVHNQVFEHVPDLDLAIAEIARVLKPGGVMLGLFPDDSCWREGHCEVPFLHWFPKGRARVYYATAFRAVGLGANHGNKPWTQWSRDFCEWLDKWTYYRSYDEIRAAFDKHFTPIEHMEAHWLDSRIGPLPVPRPLKTFVAKRWAGLVITARAR